MTFFVNFTIKDTVHHWFVLFTQTNVINVVSNWVSGAGYVVGSNWVFDALVINGGGSLSNGNSYIGYTTGANNNIALVNGDSIDQAQIDGVDSEFGVDHVLQCLDPDAAQPDQQHRAPVGIAPGGIVGNEGKAVNGASQPPIARLRAMDEADPAETLFGMTRKGGGIVEGADSVTALALEAF